MRYLCLIWCRRSFVGHIVSLIKYFGSKFKIFAFVPKNRQKTYTTSWKRVIVRTQNNSEQALEALHQYIYIQIGRFYMESNHIIAIDSTLNIFEYFDRKSQNEVKPRSTSPEQIGRYTIFFNYAKNAFLWNKNDLFTIALRSRMLQAYQTSSENAYAYKYVFLYWIK